MVQPYQDWIGITADKEELYGDKADQTKPVNTNVDLYVRFKMVQVVIEIVWDTIEDEAEQTKPEDSDEELLVFRAPEGALFFKIQRR